MEVSSYNMHRFNETFHETQMKLCFAGVDILTAMAMKRSTVFWDVTSLHPRNSTLDPGCTNK
jgi:hypothetical protein